MPVVEQNKAGAEFSSMSSLLMVELNQVLSFPSSAPICSCAMPVSANQPTLLMSHFLR